jgi:acyl carrier protein
MNRDQIVAQLKSLVTPYVTDTAALEALSETSELVNHLHINSLHLVDVVLDVESAFDIEINPTEADELRTIGSVIDLIEVKQRRLTA